MGLILGARGPFLITFRLPTRRQMGMSFLHSGLCGKFSSAISIAVLDARSWVLGAPVTGSYDETIYRVKH